LTDGHADLNRRRPNSVVPASHAMTNHVTHRMSGKTKVELFYDCVSPYSWLAFEVFSRYRTIWPMDLELKPFFLGGVMQGSGNRPPATVPAKGKYMTSDLRRLGSHFGLPLKQPSDFAKVATGTLPVQRLLTAVKLSRPDKLESVSRALWVRIWSKDQDIAEEASVKAALAAGGITDEAEQERLIAASKEQPAKDELKKVTEAALAYGAFGAPTFVVHTKGKPELYWGSDRFETMCHQMKWPWHGPQPRIASKL